MNFRTLRGLQIKRDTAWAVDVGRSSHHAEDEKANDNQFYGDR